MKKSAEFRFYEELNDFLRPEKRKKSFDYGFMGTPSVKDAIEAIGVPHTEVDLILVNGSPVDFSYRIEDGDRVSVYPVFEAFDISSVSPLRDKPLRNPRFIVDVHLGKLARYLRMLGFDTLYENGWSDAEIADIAGKEERIVITKDRGLLKRKSITRGYCVRSRNWREQIDEMLQRFDLHCLIDPFTVCLVCNGRIVRTDMENVRNVLSSSVLEIHDEFTICGACGRIYWRGTHYKRMSGFVEELRSERSCPDGVQDVYDNSEGD